MDPLVLSLGVAFFLILYIVVRCYKENGVVSDNPVKTMVVLGSGIAISLSFPRWSHFRNDFACSQSGLPPLFAACVCIRGERYQESPPLRGVACMDSSPLVM